MFDPIHICIRRERERERERDEDWGWGLVQKVSVMLSLPYSLHILRTIKYMWCDQYCYNPAEREEKEREKERERERERERGWGRDGIAHEISERVKGQVVLTIVSLWSVSIKLTCGKVLKHIFDDKHLTSKIHQVYIKKTHRIVRKLMSRKVNGFRRLTAELLNFT